MAGNCTFNGAVREPEQCLKNQKENFASVISSAIGINIYTPFWTLLNGG